MGYQVDYQWVRLRGCVTEQNCNARGRNRAVIGEGVSKLSEGMCLIYFDMMLRCWNQGWTDWPVQCFSKYWWHKIKCTLTWMGQKLYMAGFRIPTVWFETYKDPFLCKLLNFIRTNLQGIHQIQKESHWIKVVRLLLSRIQIGATTKVFSAGPYCGSRSALRLSGDGWPSEGSCSSSHLRLNSIYHTLKSCPPTPRRRQAGRWQRFQGDFTARAQPLACVWWGEVCLILITELRAQLKRDASAFIIVLHQTVCLRDGLSSKEIRGFIQDKTKDAVMIKRNWNWQNFICFLICFCWDVVRMGGAIWSSNCAC